MGKMSDNNGSLLVIDSLEKDFLAADETLPDRLQQISNKLPTNNMTCTTAATTEADDDSQNSNPNISSNAGNGSSTNGADKKKKKKRNKKNKNKGKQNKEEDQSDEMVAQLANGERTGVESTNGILNGDDPSVERDNDDIRDQHTNGRHYVDEREAELAFDEKIAAQLRNMNPDDLPQELQDLYKYQLSDPELRGMIEKSLAGHFDSLPDHGEGEDGDEEDDQRFYDAWNQHQHPDLDGHPEMGYHMPDTSQRLDGAANGTYLKKQGRSHQNGHHVEVADYEYMQELQAEEARLQQLQMQHQQEQVLMNGYEDPQMRPQQENSGEPTLYDLIDDPNDYSEDEGVDDYKLGGYHPVHIGEIFMGRYLIIQKLGWGHFSTVWLCRDMKYDNFVAMKVQKSAPNYLEAAYDEVEILRKVSKNSHKPEWLDSVKEYYKNDAAMISGGVTRDHTYVVQLLSAFLHNGPGGRHFCMVFEIMGVNLLEIIKRYNYRGIPLPIVRKIARQILMGLDYLHRECGIIHTDLKPENVLICLTQKELVEILTNGCLNRAKGSAPENVTRFRKYVRGDAPLPSKLSQPGSPVKPEKTSSKHTALGRMQSSKESTQFEESSQATDNSNTKLSRKEKQKLKKKNKKKRKREQERLAKLTADGETTEKNQANEAAEAKQEDEVKESATSEVQAEASSEVSTTAAKPEEEERQDNTESKKAREPTESTGRGGGEEDEDFGSKRGPKLDENVQIKIVDLGNACWTHHHFSSLIQTRQYRSPEVILGITYNPTADIWSLASMLFELITGDFLFEPRSGPNYDKDDDHLAQMMELLQKMPKNFALSGKHSKNFFNRKGELRKIDGFHYWPLKNVLTEKYKIKENEAIMLADFLLPMLEYSPDKRASAQTCLAHPWLDMPSEHNFKMTDEEFTVYCQKNQRSETDEDGNARVLSDDSVLHADCEDNDEMAEGDDADSDWSDLEEEETQKKETEEDEGYGSLNTSFSRQFETYSRNLDHMKEWEKQ